MSLKRALQVLTCLTAFWAFVMLAMFAELHRPAVILFLTFFFLGIFRERLNLRVANAFWLALSILVLVVAGWGWFSLNEKLYSVVYLFLYLEINKLWTASRNRDLLQIYGLTFFQVLAASVSTASIFFAPALALYLLLVLAALITVTMKRDAELAYLEGAGAKERGALAAAHVVRSSMHGRRSFERLMERTYLTPRFARWLTLMLGGIIVVGTGLFFIVPRLQAQSFLSGIGPSSGDNLVSGFSDVVDFTGMGEIQTNPAVAMRVIPGNGFKKIDGQPAIDVLRLRGTTLDFYDGRRWSKGPMVRQALGPAERRRSVAFGLQPAYDNPKGVFEAQIQLEPNRYGFIFGPDRTSRFTFDKDSVSAQYDPVAESIQVDINNWVNTLKYSVECSTLKEEWWKSRDSEKSPAVSLIQEFSRVWSRPFAKGDAGGLSPELRAAYLQLPNQADIDTVREIANEWTGSEKNPVEIARTIEAYLRQRYLYSLDVSFSRSPNHLTRFLREVKAGHCEYFATAMTLMLRSRGIPSRIVNGYATDEWINSNGGYYIVRQEHAHSWVEAYFQGNGWVTFDPTPYNGIGGNRIPMTFYRWVTRWFDTVKLVWYNSIIDYDIQDQGFFYRALFRSGDLIPSMGRAITPGFLSGVTGQDFKTRKGLLLVVIASVMLVVGGLLVRELARTRGAKGRGGDSAREAARRERIIIAKYMQLLRALGELRARRASDTPLEYARGVTAEREALADFLPITEMYYNSRFNEVKWGEAEDERVNALLRRFEE